MKKLLALVLAVVMMMGVASVAFAEETNSLDTVKAAGVLKVGIDAAFAPLTFKDETGAYVGYDIELAAAVAEKLGVAVEYVEVDWANLDAALADGSIDCVWSGMTIDANRQKTMTISDAYLQSNTVILVHKDVAGFIEDLADKTIVFQAGTTIEDYLTEQLSYISSMVILKTTATSDDAIAAMLAGEADAVMIDSVYANYQIANNEALADYITIENLLSDSYGIGFAKGDYLLCGAVEEALYEMAQDGSLAEITVKWFGEDVALIGK